MIATASNTLLATIPFGDAPAGIAVTPDGSRVYVSNNGVTPGGSVSVIETATNTVSTTIPTAEGPWGVVIAPDGQTAYVLHSAVDLITVISTTTNSVTGTIPLQSSGNDLAIMPAPVP